MPGFAKDINSSANATFKELQSLVTTKGIQKHRSAIISGEKFIHEILQDHSERVTAWITMDETQPPTPTLTWYRLAKPLFDELDVFGTGKPLLVVSVSELSMYEEKRPWPIGCTLFIPFQNPDNCGAVIRTAAAFGVERVVLLKEAAHPFHPKSARAAGPALFKVELLRGPSISELNFTNIPYVSLSGEGSALKAYKFPERFALVPGVEGPGVPQHLRANALSIPIKADVESLNAATATAIALYEWKRLS
jgi:tRNA G18 (ribose-2'-O)-methylase SpoU